MLGKGEKASSPGGLREKALVGARGGSICHRGPPTITVRKSEAFRDHPRVAPSPLVWGPGPLGVLPCIAAGTQQNPGSPWHSAHCHGNSLAAPHWVVCSIYFYGTHHHGTYLL